MSPTTALLAAALALVASAATTPELPRVIRQGPGCGNCNFFFCGEAGTPTYEIGEEFNVAFTGPICKEGMYVGHIDSTGEAWVSANGSPLTPISMYEPEPNPIRLLQPFSPSFFKSFTAFNGDFEASGVGHEHPQRNQALFLDGLCVVLPLGAYQELDPMTGNVIENYAPTSLDDCVSFYVTIDIETPAPPGPAPTDGPAPPTDAPAPPTDAPAPPTDAPAPPTDAPTDAPAPPTDAPTDAPAPPTDAPAPPTDAPTDAPAPPTDAPTDAPAPPTDAPTDAPAPPTDAPTDAPAPVTPAPTPPPGSGSSGNVCMPFMGYERYNAIFLGTTSISVPFMFFGSDTWGPVGVCGDAFIGAPVAFGADPRVGGGVDCDAQTGPTLAVDGTLDWETSGTVFGTTVVDDLDGSSMSPMVDYRCGIDQYDGELACDDLRAFIQNVNGAYCAAADTGTTTITGGSVVFDCEGSGSAEGPAYVTIQASATEALNTWSTANCPYGVVVRFVGGDVVVGNGGMQQVDNTKTVYAMCDGVDTFTNNGLSVQASIIGYNTHYVGNSGNHEGQIFVGSYEGDTQIHYFPLELC